MMPTLVVKMIFPNCKHEANLAHSAWSRTDGTVLLVLLRAAAALCADAVAVPCLLLYHAPANLQQLFCVTAVAAVMCHCQSVDESLWAHCQTEP